jgi:hypothetical protein
VIIPYWQARELLVVDPETGKQIEHVKAADPDECWLEVWSTYECHPDHKSVWVEGGKTVERDYMLMQMTDMATGKKSYATTVQKRNFDLVNKYSGEVVREARLTPPPEIVEPLSDADTRP